MPESFPRVALPSPSTQRALDESADRARLNLARLQTSRQNTQAILSGLGGLADVARQHFTAIQQADDFLLSDRASTDLVTAAHTWERDMAHSDNPEAALADYWEQWDTMVNELGGNLTPGAQRSFLEYAGKVRRQRVPYVLELAEARTGELMGMRYNERRDALMRAGNADGMKRLNGQFARYLPASWMAPGGGAHQSVVEAERVAVMPSITELARDFGAGTSASWALNPANTPNHTPQERIQLARMAEEYARAFDAQRTEQEARQLESTYQVLHQAMGAGRPLLPDQVGRVVREAGFTGETAATLTKRLVEGVGADLYAEHLQGRVLISLDEAVTDGLEAEEVPSFVYSVNWAQMMGIITDADASDYRKQAQGVIEPAREVGDEHIRSLFGRLHLQLAAINAGLDPGEAVQGNTLLDEDGRRVDIGDLSSAYLTMVTKDGRPIRKSLAGLQQQILREFRTRYNTMVESGQVAQDATEVAAVVMDQWLRYVMPGIQQAETISGTGEELYSGPYVFHPGSGIPGTQLVTDPGQARALEKLEGKFDGPVTFADAFEQAGGVKLLKDRFEAGGQRSWFSDAWAVQNMMEEFPRSGVVASSADPVYEQITGIDALNASGVRLPADIQRDINALMQSGQFHRAGEAAAQMLPADEEVLQGLLDQGLLAGFKMVRGGAVVKLHPLTPWVGVPYTYTPARDDSIDYNRTEGLLTAPYQRPAPVAFAGYGTGDFTRDRGWSGDPGQGQGWTPGRRGRAIALTAQQLADAEAELARLSERRSEFSETAIQDADLRQMDRDMHRLQAQAAHHRQQLQDLQQRDDRPDPVQEFAPAFRDAWNWLSRPFRSPTAEPAAPASPEIPEVAPTQPQAAAQPTAVEATAQPRATPGPPIAGAPPLRAGVPAAPARPQAATEPGQPPPPEAGEPPSQPPQPSPLDTPPPSTTEPLPPEDELPPYELPDSLTYDTGPPVTDEPVEMYEIGVDSAGTRIYAPSNQLPSLASLRAAAQQPSLEQLRSAAGQPSLGDLRAQQPGPVPAPGAGLRVPGAPSASGQQPTPGVPGRLPGPGAGSPGGEMVRVPGGPGTGPGGGQPPPEQLGAPPGSLSWEGLNGSGTRHFARPAPSVPSGVNRAGELVHDEPSMPRYPIFASRSPTGEPTLISVPIAMRDGQPVYYVMGAEPGMPLPPQQYASAPGQPGAAQPPQSGAAPAGEPGAPPSPVVETGAPGEPGQAPAPAGEPPADTDEPEAPAAPTGPGAARVQADVPAAPTAMHNEWIAEPRAPGPPVGPGAAPEQPTAGLPPGAPAGTSEPGTPGAPAGPGAAPGQPSVPTGAAPAMEPGMPGAPAGPGAAPGMPTHPAPPLYGTFSEGDLADVAQAMARAWLSGADVPMIDEAVRYLRIKTAETIAPAMPVLDVDEVRAMLVDFEEAYTSPRLALAHVLEKQENPAMAAAATLAPEPTEPRGGFLAREPVPEPGRPPHPGVDAQRPGEARPPQRPRRWYEPRPEDLPAAPQYGTGNRFMDASPLEPREPQHQLATTLEGAPYPDRSAQEPVSPEQRRRETEQLRREQDEARHRGYGRQAGPGVRQPVTGEPPRPAGAPPSAAAMPPIPGPPDQLPMHRAQPGVPAAPTAMHNEWLAEPYRPPGAVAGIREPGVPQGWQQSPQEWMSYAVMEKDVRARIEAIKGATSGMTEDPMPADVMAVANAVADRMPWREPPAEIAEMAERAMDGEELEEQEIVAMSAWHLNTAYPGMKWWNDAPEQRPKQPRRPLPGGRDFIRNNAQVVDLIKSQEGFSADPYPDPGGDPWTIGWGQTRMYRRNARGRVIEVGPVTQKTKSMSEEKASEQLGLAIEYHYDALVREMPREALDWLNDSQLAALAAMTYNRGPASMGSEAEEYKIRAGDSLWKIASQKGVSYQRLLQANRIENPDMIRAGDTLTIPAAPGTEALRRGLIDQDLDAVAGAWFDTFNIERALSHDYAQGILNRRAASALFMFHGYPDEGEIMDAGGWARWRDAAIGDPRITELRRGSVGSGLLMRVGDPQLKEILPGMKGEDLQWAMKLQGLDPTAAGDRWLWIAPPNGDLPAHYQPWKKVVRRGPGGSLIYLLEAPAAAS